jgi:hypothetical protein
MKPAAGKLVIMLMVGLGVTSMRPAPLGARKAAMSRSTLGPSLAVNEARSGCEQESLHGPPH